MKIKYLVFIILLRFLISPETASSQAVNPVGLAFKKAIADTTQSTINPRVSTFGLDYYVSGKRVPKGTGGIGYLSETEYNASMVKVGDTTFVSNPISLTDIVTTSDQTGIFISSSLDQNSGDVSLVKTDPQSNILWSTILVDVSGNGSDSPLNMRVRGSNLFISGTCYSGDKVPSVGFNAFVSKLDLNGNTVWTKFFYGFGATSVAPASNGKTFVLVRGYDFMWNLIQTVYVLDVFGNTLNSVVIQVPYTATATALDEQTGVLVVALKEDLATSLLAFMTVSENCITSNLFLTNQPGSVVQMEDSYAGFVVSGSYGGFSFAGAGAYAAEYNLQFNALWTRKESNTSIGSSIFTGLTAQKNNIGWVFAGTRTRSYYPGSTYDMIATKLTYPNPSAVFSFSGSTALCVGDSLTMSIPFDTGATYVWKKYGVTIVGATSNSITVTSAGKYKVIVTNKWGRVKNSSVVNVSLTNCRLAEETDNPEVISGAEVRMEMQEVLDLKVNPNPATDVVRIEKIKVGEHIIVTDILGKVVITQIAGSPIEEPVDVSQLKPGIYVVIVGKQTQKIVKK